MALSAMKLKKLKAVQVGQSIELQTTDGATYKGVVTEKNEQSIEIAGDGFERVVDYMPDGGEVAGFTLFALTDPLQQKLKALQTGTVVSIVKTTGEMLTGTVADNNGESLDIEGAGFDLVVDYKEIRSVEVGSTVPVTPVNPVPGGVQPAGKPVTAAVPEPFMPFYWQEDLMVPQLSDAELKNLFDDLPADKKNLAQAGYSSFAYNIKNSNPAKARMAAAQLRQTIQQTGRTFDPELNYLCGAMGVRAKLPRSSELMALCNHTPEAAILYYKEENYEEAVEQAVRALESDPLCSEIDALYMVIDDGCLRLNNANCLDRLDKTVVNGSGRYRDTLFRHLAAQKNIPLDENADPESRLQVLQAGFAGQRILPRAAEKQQPVPPAVQPAPVQPAVQPQPAPKPLVRMDGAVIQVDWIRSRGVVGAVQDGKEVDYSFSFDDVTSRELSAQLTHLSSDELAKTSVMVSFCLRGAQAIDLQPSQTSPLKKLNTMNTENATLEEMKPYIALLMKTADAGSALDVALRRAVACKDREPGALEWAKQLYLDNQSKIIEDDAHYDSLIQMYRSLNDVDNAIDRLEYSLDHHNIKAKQRVNSLSMYIRICMDEYNASGNTDLLKRVLKRGTEYLKIYRENPELADKINISSYAKTGLPAYMARAEIALGLYDAAAKHIQTLQNNSTTENGFLKTVLELRKELSEKRDGKAEQEPVEEPAEPAELEEQAVEEPAGETPAEPAEPAPEPEKEPEEEEAGEEQLTAEPYRDADGWKALDTSKKAVVDYALHADGPNRLAILLTTLKAASELNPEILPVYHAASLAAENPMEKLNYSLSGLQSASGEIDEQYADFIDCCRAASCLRAAFQSEEKLDYVVSSLQILRDGISVFNEMESLGPAFDVMQDFRRNQNLPMDLLADYRQTEERNLDAKLTAVAQEAAQLYQRHVVAPHREFARLMRAQKLAFGEQGELATLLRLVMQKDHKKLAQERENFVSHWYGGKEPEGAPSLTVVDALIQDCWDKAGESLLKQKENDSLQGSRRNNMRSPIKSMVAQIGKWYKITDRSGALNTSDPAARTEYAKQKPILRQKLEAVQAECDKLLALGECGDQKKMGYFLIRFTACSLLERLDGSWTEEKSRFFFADFLRGDWIQLDEDFMPVLEPTFCVLKDFNVLTRIRRHAETVQDTMEEHLQHIYEAGSKKHNFGTADLILQYLEASGQPVPELPAYAEACRQCAAAAARSDLQHFREQYALWMSCGRVAHADPFLAELENTICYWYLEAERTDNYGFFYSLMEQCERHIGECAQQRGTLLEGQLERLIQTSEKNGEPVAQSTIDGILTMIRNQNYTVAEDLMNHINEERKPFTQSEALLYLDQFWSEYKTNYRVNQDSARDLLHGSGRALAQNWIGCTPADENSITRLLAALGWTDFAVHRKTLPNSSTELYHVTQTRKLIGRVTSQHPIAAFGSQMARGGFDVVCLYETYDCDSLLKKFEALDAAAGAKLVLLDGVLSMPERRKLARKIKQNDNLRRTYLVLDRVLLGYLCNHYPIENTDSAPALMNQMLMAVGMPFSSYQPYVTDAANYMPPEMFYGRVSELRRIEESSADQPDSVNLIYGGRQLGKSALLKKAQADVDGTQVESGVKRALRVPIPKLGCAESCRMLAQSLINEKVLDEDCLTEDWNTLTSCIQKRLYVEEPEQRIAYLLVMLDEADDFISDCANYGYAPITALKDVQEKMPDRFKFVLAGLHDVVRFNRAAALGDNSGVPHLGALNIKPFTREESRQLLLEPLSYLGISIASDEQATQIIATTNYFPGLIQLYCQKMVESLRSQDYGRYVESQTPPYKVTDDNIGRVLKDGNFLQEIHKKFEMTLRLDRLYFRIAWLIAYMNYMEPQYEGCYTAQDLVEYARNWGMPKLKDQSGERMRMYLDELQDLNILRSVGKGAYEFASYNFRDQLGSSEALFAKLTREGEEFEDADDDINV